jgi:hypothetical protein
MPFVLAGAQQPFGPVFCFFGPAARVRAPDCGRLFSVGKAVRYNKKLAPNVRGLLLEENYLRISVGRWGPSDMKDEANFKKRMRELVEDGYVVFDKMGRWRVTEKGLTCLIACADRAVKISASHERT